MAQKAAQNPEEFRGGSRDTVELRVRRQLDLNGTGIVEILEDFAAQHPVWRIEFRRTRFEGVLLITDEQDIDGDHVYFGLNVEPNGISEIWINGNQYYRDGANWKGADTDISLDQQIAVSLASNSVIWRSSYDIHRPISGGFTSSNGY